MLAELGQHLIRRGALAVDDAIGEPPGAAERRLEEHGDHRRRRERERRVAGGLHERADSADDERVHEHEERGEHGDDQRLADHDVDVVEPVLQDRDPDRHGDGAIEQERQAANDHLVAGGRSEHRLCDEAQHPRCEEDRRADRDPTDLVALVGARRAGADHQRRDREDGADPEQDQPAEADEREFPVRDRVSRNLRIEQEAEGGCDHRHGREARYPAPPGRGKPAVREPEGEVGGHEPERDHPTPGRCPFEQGVRLQRRAHPQAPDGSDHEHEPSTGVSRLTECDDQAHDGEGGGRRQERELPDRRRHGQGAVRDAKNQQDRADRDPHAAEDEQRPCEPAAARSLPLAVDGRRRYRRRREVRFALHRPGLIAVRRGGSLHDAPPSCCTLRHDASGIPPSRHHRFEGCHHPRGAAPCAPEVLGFGRTGRRTRPCSGARRAGGGERVSEGDPRVVLITGGAGGMGRATATRFLEDGETVFLADIDEAGLAEAEADHRSRRRRTLGDARRGREARRRLRAHGRCRDRGSRATGRGGERGRRLGGGEAPIR